MLPHVLQAAKSLGIPSHERIPTKAELVTSQGAFISSSIREMLPIIRIDDAPLTDGKVPDVFQRLLKEFRAKAESTSEP